MRSLLIYFISGEIAIIGLAQANIIPGDLVSIFVQLPLVGLFAWYVLHSTKQNREWLNYLLKAQDERHHRTIELFERILEKFDARLSQMSDKIELFTQQLSINTSTVSESMRLHELREELQKIRKARDG
jgi:hypothetical protein